MNNDDTNGIRNLERMLRDPDIMETPPSSEVVAPGMLITLRPLEDDDPEDETYLLAESAEERAPGLDVELSITKGPPAAAVRAVSDAVSVDLIVLCTDNTTTDAHTSLSEQVLEDGKRSVLALHPAGAERHAFGFDLSSGHRQPTLVPTDLTPDSLAAVDFAFDLARTLPLDLHLLHLVAHGGSGARHDRTVADIEQRLRALIPADFAGKTGIHVRDGDPAAGIVKAAGEFSAACIVMGEHTQSPLRHWLTRDTSQAVLHIAPCPVWYVPGRSAS